MLTHIDLFSGIGGFSLAAEWAGFRTVAFVEIDPYCQAVLKKHWPEVPITGDIKEFKWPMADSKGTGQLRKAQSKNDGAHSTRGWRHDAPDNDQITLITGGFPCQPFSVAGKRRGTDDDRFLWPEMFRVIKEVRPRWVVGENVAGIVRMALDDCLADLESEGYTTQAFIIPACAVNAPHRRDRVWIVAHSIRGGKEPGAAGGTPDKPSQAGAGWWAVEPDVGRVAHGVPSRVDRLKCLGNAIVPQVAYQIIKGIAKIERGET